MILLRHAADQPTDAQKEAGNYRKRKVQWNGLTISIENEAGSYRRGRNRAGVEWEVLVRFAYGYVNGSMGVDGDQVDVYLGPNLDAPLVYVIHQRQYGNWSAYDEDKCMVGFDSESDARDAFLSNYNDPRFLGDVTTLTVEAFVAKVRATKEKPAMIKALLLIKSRVAPYLRGGKTVQGYERQASLFGDLPEQKKPPKPVIALPTTARPRQEHDDWNWSGQPSDPRKLVLRPRSEGGTAVGYQDHDGRTYGVREIPHDENHDRAVSAWKMAAGQRGHEVDDGRPIPEGHSEKHYVTLQRDKRTAYLAGPFDSHDEAKAHVDRAVTAANRVDPFSHFDAFGVSKRTAAAHPPGVLNRHLGIGEAVSGQ